MNKLTDSTVNLMQELFVYIVCNKFMFMISNFLDL